MSSVKPWGLPAGGSGARQEMTLSGKAERGYRETMKLQEPVARLCQESRKLRLQAEDVKNQAAAACDGLRRAVGERRALMKRLKECEQSLRRTAYELDRKLPGDQRGSAR